MTKVTPFLAGRIAEYHARMQCSVSATARHWGLAWETARRAISFPAHGARKPRRTSAYVRNRRATVARMAVLVESRGSAVWPKFPSAPAIAAELCHRGVAVSSRTVQRDLKASGFSSLVRRHVPTRNPAVWAKRLTFCRRMTGSYAQRLINKLVFSDEHGMSTNDCSNRLQWVRSSADVLTREEMRIHNTFRFQMFAAIGINYKSAAIILRKPRAANDDEHKSFRQNSHTYIRQCLSKIAPALRGKVFMQDGASSHTARSTSAYLATKGIDVLASWPSNSPDLNPIEELWAELNRRVANRHPMTQLELEHFTLAEWNAFPQALINRYVRSFIKKCKRCVDRGGRC